MVVLEPLNDGDSAQDPMISARQGLKYLPPDLNFLDNVRPTKYMKDFFWEHMEFYHITDEVMTSWEILAEREADEEEL